MNAVAVDLSKVPNAEFVAESLKNKEDPSWLLEGDRDNLKDAVVSALTRDQKISVVQDAFYELYGESERALAENAPPSWLLNIEENLTTGPLKSLVNTVSNLFPEHIHGLLDTICLSFVQLSGNKELVQGIWPSLKDIGCGHLLGMTLEGVISKCPKATVFLSSIKTIFSDLDCYAETVDVLIRDLEAAKTPAS
jgi:hypothetical protein